METVDVAVVGGGMAGCLSAYYLEEAGLRVAIIEKTGVGNQASGNSAGGLNPLHGQGIPGPLSDLAMESFGLHLALWESLASEGFAGFFPRRVKRLFLAFEQAGLAAYEGSVPLYNQHKNMGFEARIIDAAEVKKLDHRINPDVHGALYTVGNAAIESLAYNRAIAQAAVKRGARVIDATATGLDITGSRVKGVVTDQGSISCDHVVIATGAWGREPSEWLGVSVSVEPLKGEMLLMEIPGEPLSFDLSYDNVSFFCRGEDYVWLGATETNEGFDSSPTDRARRHLLEKGSKMLPVITNANIKGHTVGLRPVTPDGLPIVGYAPGYENAYLCTGAGRKGTLLSAGMGKAIADLITLNKTSISIKCADPGRLVQKNH